MRTLVLSLWLASALHAQSWYPHAPTGAGPNVCVQAAGSGGGAFSVNLCTYGDCSGEFWAFLDFHVGGAQIPFGPILYSTTIDADLVTSYPPVYLIPPLTYDPPQAGGCALTIDAPPVSTGTGAAWPIAEGVIPEAVLGGGLLVEIHILGNMTHEVDGSGWFAVKDQFTIAP